MAALNQGDLFDAYFRRADLDGDGKISGAEAVAFFQGANLSKQVLAQVYRFRFRLVRLYFSSIQLYCGICARLRREII